MSSPTARALAHLRGIGDQAKVVKRGNPYANIRQDLFGVDFTRRMEDLITILGSGAEAQEGRRAGPAITHLFKSRRSETAATAGHR
jgi:hypothetical protein